jgi:hypothetical protein
VNSGEGKEAVLFEKKDPKKLFSPGACVASSESQMDKSFLLLFFKKEGACLP